MAQYDLLRGDHGEDRLWDIHKGQIETLNEVLDCLNNIVMEEADLQIKAGGETVAKNGSAIRAMVEGSLVSISANTDMPALSGTVTAEKHNVFSIYIDANGVLTSSMGTEGDTLATVVLPTRPADKAQVGMGKVSPSGGSFIGGTTALDDATANTEYIDTPGPQLSNKQSHTLTVES